MDILSHGLWGGIIAGRKNRRDFWWSFFFGIVPDMFSFGIFTIMTTLGLASGPDWKAGMPPESDIPIYVHQLYNITHSLVVFAVIFLIVWYIRKKPYLPLLAWAIAIILDIPTHTAEFFPTPFLWPFFDNIRFDGISWSQPIILLPNFILLVLLYVWFFIIKKHTQKYKIKKL